MIGDYEIHEIQNGGLNVGYSYGDYVLLKINSSMQSYQQKLELQNARVVIEYLKIDGKLPSHAFCVATYK